MLVPLHSSCKWRQTAISFICGLFRIALICSKELKGLLPIFEVIYLHCCYHAATSVLKSLKCLKVTKPEKNGLEQDLLFVWGRTGGEELHTIWKQNQITVGQFWSLRELSAKHLWFGARLTGKVSGMRWEPMYTPGKRLVTRCGMAEMAGTSCKLMSFPSHAQVLPCLWS